MNKQSFFTWLLIAGVVVIAVGVVMALQASTEDNLPENTIRLDQLNIQTQDPQPAGKNITP